MGYLEPWTDIDGITERINRLMREEYELVNAIGELLEAGTFEDVPALVSMLQTLEKKNSNSYMEKYT